ncbi:MAG: SEC-C domain-containing protein [Planctomycetaceae bacterium]|nr:SEC-C domain-containing protein [Planctomycetaceae bacterium]
MKAFDMMWKRIGEQITTAIFRLEEMNPDFVGHLWRITSTTKQEAVSALEAEPESTGDADSQSGGRSQSGGEKAIEPIRNSGRRIGRNDPCPCGSGKKFKNCCMGD